MLERVKTGLAAGLAAGLSVAAVVLVYDVARLEPLATPTRLASTVVGVPIEFADAMGVLSWVAAVLKAGWALVLFTIVHFGAFALVGLGGAYALRPHLLPPNMFTGALYGGLVGTAVLYGGLALAAPAFLAAPDWRIVVLANVIAGVVIVSQIVDVPDPDEDVA